MKNLDFKSMIIGVLLAMLIVATAEKSPRAWEYKVVRYYLHEQDAALNAAAS